MRAIEEKLQIDMFEILEDHFEQSNRPRWKTAVRTIAKLLTPEEKKWEQFEFNDNINSILMKKCSLFQRDLYLLEERDALHKQASTEGQLSPKESQRLKRIEEEMDGAYSKFDHINKELYLFAYQSPLGAWTREYVELSWEMEKPICILQGGCCARACRCCSKPRRGLAGQVPRFEMDYKFHCTSNCGCCIRWKKSLKVSEEEKMG